jgi:hypothetical protein
MVISNVMRSNSQFQILFKFHISILNYHQSQFSAKSSTFTGLKKTPKILLNYFFLTKLVDKIGKLEKKKLEKGIMHVRHFIKEPTLKMYNALHMWLMCNWSTLARKTTNYCSCTWTIVARFYNLTFHSQNLSKIRESLLQSNIVGTAVDWLWYITVLWCFFWFFGISSQSSLRSITILKF